MGLRPGTVSICLRSRTNSGTRRQKLILFIVSIQLLILIILLSAILCSDQSDTITLHSASFLSLQSHNRASKPYQDALGARLVVVCRMTSHNRNVYIYNMILIISFFNRMQLRSNQYFGIFLHLVAK